MYKKPVLDFFINKKFAYVYLDDSYSEQEPDVI